jgi:spermidine/putrescine transport system ATP-binding protein
MLELDGLTTTYSGLTAVDDVSLRIDEGELFCLLGPSGCGKSSTLRTIAGLESPAAGRVVLDGTDVTDAPPYDRDCSIVFQDWALFPNKSVLSNVAFGLKMRGVGRDERARRARETLALVEMDEYADAAPNQLSGGQKQRVALARSLTVDPDLLLLDEPLSNLDRRLRETMQFELKDIHDRLDTTMLYVTHDQDEAFTLADRLGVMDDGQLVQVGDPATLYDDPVNRFVESFLGSTNFVACTVATGEAQASRDHATDGPVLDTPLGVRIRAPLATDADRIAPGDPVDVSLRPDRLTLLDAPADVDAPRRDPAGDAHAQSLTDGTALEDGGNRDRDREGGEARPTGTADGAARIGEADADGGTVVSGTVSETIYRGADVRIRLSVGEADLFVEEPTATGLRTAAGDTVHLHVEPGEALYFDETGARLR